MASVIQGSSLGPASYIVTASDLRPLSADNDIIKFADDTYLIVPAASSNTSEDELAHVKSWAAENNLRLNCSKSQEIIFQARGACGAAVQLPPACPGITRVHSLMALGVVINDRLTATDHVSGVLASCSSSLYALHVLRHHGVSASSLQDVFRATVLAKLLYSSPAWSGHCSAADRARLDALLRRSKRNGYCAPPGEIRTVTELLSVMSMIVCFGAF
jgi:hypothetical protein